MGLRERHGEHTPGRPARGRPRSEAAERAIIEGVLHLLEDGVSISELTVERVARTAGVGKATIYRRWGGKDELLVDVLAELEGTFTVEATGESVRGDLIAYLEAVREMGGTKGSSALWRTVIMQGRDNPKLAELYHHSVVERRRDLMRTVLRRGIERGELRADLDVELTVDMLVGPMLVRTILHEWRPTPDDLSARLVDALLEGARSRT
ncbi:putative HTH-type transcriptional regulator [Streptomyces sp. RB5]|uniref:Putative HTH-type transcriptional regulator n=1 Tax=Streptomyces smaragdinus TaxID=2585196 RepID=A0A7K0CCK0_9ACTN|nr:TetR/AcrR family transcriptional regulator [Streptomyces smaragdinus]MQY11185.1 putative HTH-type transcriptional regulator [Streptomyces smaragdinus]